MPLGLIFSYLTQWRLHNFKCINITSVMWYAWILYFSRTSIWSYCIHIQTGQPDVLYHRKGRPTLQKTRSWKYCFHLRYKNKQRIYLFIFVTDFIFRMYFRFLFFTTKMLCRLWKKHNEMLLYICKLYFTGHPALFSRLFTLSGPWHTPCIHYSKQTQGCLAIKANYFGFFVTVAVLLHGWRLIGVKLMHGFLPGLSL